VIVISGELTELTLPESVLADAFFAKGQYSRKLCLQKSTSYFGSFLPGRAQASPTKRRSG
jgi:hypothetical protein